LTYLHTLTIPTPFPVGPVNCYLADGDEPTLIDTGTNDPAALAALREQLRSHGLALADIRRVVVTHAHLDHSGLAARIVAESGARVLSHERNRWWLTDFEREWERRYRFYAEVLRQSGAPPAFAEQLGPRLEWMKRLAASVPLASLTPIDDGDALVLGGETWRVVFAPGHASGLICLFEPHTRTLISSDHLLRDITSNPFLEPPARGESARPRALVQYIASMQKVARLNVRRALPAHGEPIDDVRALVDARLAFHRQRLEYIERQLDSGARTAFELCGILFPNLKPQDLLLGLSEVIGHLDILESEGRVRREESDGVARYAPFGKAR